MNKIERVGEVANMSNEFKDKTDLSKRVVTFLRLIGATKLTTTCNGEVGLYTMPNGRRYILEFLDSSLNLDYDLQLKAGGE